MVDPVPPDMSANVTQAASEIVRIVGSTSNGRAIAANLTDPLVFITRAFRGLFLPIDSKAAEVEAVHAEKAARKLAARLSEIPDDDRVVPKASIAVPIVQGLALTVDEESLRDAYVNLLGAAADGRSADAVHPGYAETVKQLSAKEVGALDVVLRTNPPTLPAARFQVGKRGGSSAFVQNEHVLQIEEDGLPVVRPNLRAEVDNWIRLGLVTVQYDRWIDVPDAYDWVKSRPEYLNAVENHENEFFEVRVDNGVLAHTAYGQGFAVAALGVYRS